LWGVLLQIIGEEWLEQKQAKKKTRKGTIRTNDALVKRFATSNAPATHQKQQGRTAQRD